MSNTDNNKQQKEAFYIRLKDELDKNTSWPSKYMYKFIVPNEPENEKKITNSFTNSVKITKNYSRSGKYISYTIVTTEKSGDEVIKRYKSMEDIEGLIAL